MPITFTAPPQPVVDLTQSKLQDMARARHFSVASLAQAAPEQIHLASAHAVYNLGLRDIVGSTATLTGAPLTAWRFLVQAGAPELSAAETLPSREGSAPEFSSVNAGPFVQGSADAFAAIGSDPAIAQGNWEGRLLRIPALYIYAAWAHPATGNNDRLRPVRPAPPFLDPDKTYTWQEFLTAVRPAAEQRLATDDGTRN